MHSHGTAQSIAREIVKEKTQEMQERALDFALWLQDAEEGGAINGREADKLRSLVIAALS
jgi:hypothetical protein